MQKCERGSEGIETESHTKNGQGEGEGERGRKKILAGIPSPLSSAFYEAGMNKRR